MSERPETGMRRVTPGRRTDPWAKGSNGRVLGLAISPILGDFLRRIRGNSVRLSSQIWTARSE